MPFAEECLVPFPNGARRNTVPVTEKFRSTWLSSSLRAIRERNLLDRYLGYLAPAHHDAVLSAVVGVWLPAEVALAHYEACDRLQLAQTDILSIGAEVGKHVQGTVFSIAVRLAKGAGVTPFTVAVRFPDIWKRIWVGGGVAVYKLGPKEARLEIAGWPSARTTYCRVAMRGVLSGITELFCTKVYVKDIPALCTPMTLGYRFAWA